MRRILLPSIGRFGPVLAACIAFALVSIWLIFGAIAYESYLTEWQAARQFGDNVASLLDADIARSEELYDLSIEAAANDASDATVMSLPQPLRRKVLFDQSANASGLGTMLVLDKTGTVIADSRGIAPARMNLADRDYFLAQRDGTATRQPFVSRPFKSRISGQLVIALSRPVPTPGGAFDGVVVGTVQLDYFGRLFQTVRLPPGSAITLVRRDGMLLMREPLVQSDLGRNVASDDLLRAMAHASSGAFIRRSLVDNVERLVVFRQVGSLPVYLAIGLSTDAFMQRWRWRVTTIGVGFVVLSVIVLFLGFMLARELSRRTLAERTLSELAATDALTLLANRRRFDEMLEIEWRRGIRESTALALLMIDGDFFKAFNDTYGHLEGDAALRVIAGILRKCVDRPGDLVARFGGEEFVILLPRTDRQGADRVAQTIHQAVVALAMPHAGSPLGVLTVSIGVASRRPSPLERSSSLVLAADAALYAAKEDGRDRIVVEGARAAGCFSRRVAASPRVA